jgi:hypothetical protein
LARTPGKFSHPQAFPQAPMYSEVNNKIKFKTTRDDQQDTPQNFILNDFIKPKTTQKKKYVKELNAVAERREVLSLTMDSGAAESVTHAGVGKGYKLLQPHGPERETSYVLPDGTLITNHGEKHIKVTAKEGSRCVLRMQVTDVRKSLMSVSKVCDEGHRVMFEAAGGFIEHIASGLRTNFDRRNGVYVLDVDVEPSSGFRGQDASM